MKKLTRRSFTAAGIIAAIAGGITSLTGCDFDLLSCANPNVYGPPPEDLEPKDDEDSEDGFEPDENEVVGVYGPPEWFGTEEPDNDDYDPADNELVDVYGPPEYFGIDAEDESEDNG